MYSIHKISKRVSRIVVALALVTSQTLAYSVGFFITNDNVASAAVSYVEDGKIRICHSTDSANNPYNSIEVAVEAADGLAGNNGNGQPDHYGEHTGPVFDSEVHDQQNRGWGDIIPPIEGAHSGRNWTVEGQLIWNNDCSEPETGYIEVKKEVDLGDGNGFVSDNPSLYGFMWGIDQETPLRAFGTTSELLNKADGPYTITENIVTGYEYVGWYDGNNSCENPDGIDFPSIAILKDKTRRITLCNEKVKMQEPDGRPFVRVTYICQAGFTGKALAWNGSANEEVAVTAGDNIFRVRYESNNSEQNAPASVPYATTQFSHSGTILEDEVIFAVTQQKVAGVKVTTTPANLYNGTASTNSNQSCEEVDPENNPYVRVTFICKASFDGVALAWTGTENEEIAVNEGDYVFRVRYEGNNSDVNTSAAVPYATTQFVSSGNIDKDEVLFETTNTAVAGVKVTTTPTNLYNGTASTNENQDCEKKVTDATVSVTKFVRNNNGGTSVATDFDVFLNNEQLIPGQLQQYNNGNSAVAFTPVDLAPGTSLVITEPNQPFGYELFYIQCQVENQTVSLPYEVSDDEEVSCIVVNRDVPATITLVKKVVNDDGGLETASAWTLIAQASGDSPIISEASVSGNDELVAATNTVSAEAGVFYLLSETGPTGYEQGEWQCEGAEFSNGGVLVAFAAQVVCEVVNNDTAPTLTLNKTVINDDGGTATEDDFQAWITDTKVDWGVPVKVTANQHITIGESILPGGENYSMGEWECEGAEYIDGGVVLQIAANAVCTVENNDPKVGLSVEKGGPSTAAAGSSVTYTFTIRNTGDVSLTELSVEDSIAGKGVYVSGDNNENEMLDVDEVWLYEGAYDIPSNHVGAVENTVTVCAVEYFGLTEGEDKEENDDFPEELLLSQYDAHQRFDEIDLPRTPRSVCDEDSHTTRIPQVLASVTTTSTPEPEVLAETGQPYYIALLVSAFLVLGAVFSRKTTAIASDE